MAAFSRFESATKYIICRLCRQTAFDRGGGSSMRQWLMLVELLSIAIKFRFCVSRLNGISTWAVSC